VDLMHSNDLYGDAEIPEEIKAYLVEYLRELLVDNWLIPYQENNNAWRDNSPNILQELAEKLDINNLIKNQLQGIEELIIIPHLFLHQIPFSALPIDCRGHNIIRSRNQQSNYKTSCPYH
jgi:hypothetical protein